MTDLNEPSQKLLSKAGMKRTLALTVSVFVYIGLFQFFFHFLMGTRIDVDTILYGFLLSIITYFVIAGNMFLRYLQLDWWKLWAAMNIAGFPLSFVVLHHLDPWLEEIDILLLIFLVAPYLFIAWGIVGIGFICVRFVLSRLMGKQ